MTMKEMAKRRLLERKQRTDEIEHQAAAIRKWIHANKLGGDDTAEVGVVLSSCQFNGQDVFHARVAVLDGLAEYLLEPEYGYTYTDAPVSFPVTHAAESDDPYSGKSPQRWRVPGSPTWHEDIVDALLEATQWELADLEEIE